MYSFWHFLVVVTVLARFTFADEVVVLTDANFDSTTQAMSGEGGAWLVEFYAPWCGHCKKLAPVWDNLSNSFKEKGIDVKVGKVDATVQTGLAARFGVGGFPTIYLMQDKKFSKYTGQRTVVGFASFAKQGIKQHSNPIKPALSSEELVAVEKKKQKYQRDRAPKPVKPSTEDSVYVVTDNNFDILVQISKSKPILIKFYAPWCGHCKRLAPIWSDLALESKAGRVKAVIAKVDATQNHILRSRFGLKGYPTIKCIVDGLVYDYNGQRNIKGFSDYLKSDWAALEGSPIPAGTLLAQMEAMLLSIISDLQDSVKTKLPMLITVLITGIMIGLTVSSIINLCTEPSYPPPQYKQAVHPRVARDENTDIDNTDIAPPSPSNDKPHAE